MEEEFMNRRLEDVPPCPGCDSQDTTIAPSQAHAYQCLRCGTFFDAAENGDRGASPERGY